MRTVKMAYVVLFPGLNPTTINFYLYFSPYIHSLLDFGYLVKSHWLSLSELLLFRMPESYIHTSLL